MWKTRGCAVGNLGLCVGLHCDSAPLLQSVSLGCIHTVLLLAEKEFSHRERLPGAQVSLSLSPPRVPVLCPVGRADPGQRRLPPQGTLCPLTWKPPFPAWGCQAVQPLAEGLTGRWRQQKLPWGGQSSPVTSSGHIQSTA